MKEKRIRLIAFDMDGTVLNDEKKILKETKEALEQAARAGIEIVPATGRPFCGISDEIYRLDGVVMCLRQMVPVFMKGIQKLAFMRMRFHFLPIYQCLPKWRLTM